MQNHSNIIIPNKESVLAWFDRWKATNVTNWNNLALRPTIYLVVHGTSGSTSYETIPPIPLEISGGVLSAVDMVVQRRDRPCRQ